MHGLYDATRKPWRNPRTRRRVLATATRCIAGIVLKTTLEHLLGWR
jgi:hypothetical protein